MFDVERILAIPDFDDRPQMGLSKAGLAVIVERGGITADGTKAHSSVLKRADIKGDKPLAGNTAIAPDTAKKIKGAIAGSSKSKKVTKSKSPDNRVPKKLKMSDLKTAEVNSNNTQKVPIGKFLVASKADLELFNKYPKKVEWSTVYNNQPILAKATYTTKGYAVDARGERRFVAHKDFFKALNDIKQLGGKIIPFKADDLLLYGAAKRR
jgi:hypothetical protein